MQYTTDLCNTTDLSRYIYKVGRTMFEADQLPQHLVEHCNLFDELWVPSEFNRQTFAASGVKVPMFILPEVWEDVRYREGSDLFILFMIYRIFFVSHICLGVLIYYI